MEKKKLIELVAAIFIAVIFISSYAAFGGNSGPAAKATTTTVPQLVYVSGAAKADVVSYGKGININVMCPDSSAINSSLETFLVSLTSNGLVSGSGIGLQTIELGNATAPEMYSILAAKLGKNATCTQIVATQATVELPSRINVTYAGGSTAIFIPPSQRNYTEALNLTNSTGQKIGVWVETFVTENNGMVTGRISLSLTGS